MTLYYWRLNACDQSDNTTTANQHRKVLKVTYLVSSSFVFSSLLLLLLLAGRYSRVVCNFRVANTCTPQGQFEVTVINSQKIKCKRNTFCKKVIYFMFMYLRLITNIKDHYNLYNQINLEKKSSDPRPARAINNDRSLVSFGRNMLTFSATSETEGVANCKNVSRDPEVRNHDTEKYWCRG